MPVIDPNCSIGIYHKEDILERTHVDMRTLTVDKNRVRLPDLLKNLQTRIFGSKNVCPKLDLKISGCGNFELKSQYTDT